MQEAAAPLPTPVPWTPRRLFTALRELGRLRIISRSGPSTFEALCELGPFGIADGFLNAITPAYHWHLELARLRHVESLDETYPRSGRRVLGFALREVAGAEPFLSIFLYRAPEESFGAEREQRFARMHAELSGGVALTVQEDAR
jgi:hypothetical protein